MWIDHALDVRENIVVSDCCRSWTDVAGMLLMALGLSIAGGKIVEVTSGRLHGVLRPQKTT